jgi:hypothetical protein
MPELTNRKAPSDTRIIHPRPVRVVSLRYPNIFSWIEVSGFRSRTWPILVLMIVLELGTTGSNYNSIATHGSSLIEPDGLGSQPVA